MHCTNACDDALGTYIVQRPTLNFQLLVCFIERSELYYHQVKSSEVHKVSTSQTNGILTYAQNSNEYR